MKTVLPQIETPASQQNVLKPTAGEKRQLKIPEFNRYNFWIMLKMIFTALYLYWRFRYTIPLGYGFISMFAGISLLVVEFMGALESYVHFSNMRKVDAYPTPTVPLELFPDVDIFIATYNEPIELLYKTINGCVHMDYPDKSKVHIHVCDDGRREAVRELAESFGVNHITRGDNKHAKAGNLNHAMSVTSAPLIVTQDADMIPKHDLLMKMVPFFVDADIENQFRDEKDNVRMGFVQSPQSFYNPDLFQFNLFSEGRIPNEQDYFYKDIQVSRNRSNSVIYGGSNTMISRKALEDVGGFFTNAITEDFATGILLQKKGYTCIAINEVLASGLSATDLPSLIQQRTRWGRGCVSTGRKLHILLTPKLSFRQKLNHWASIWYWYFPIKRLIYIFTPIMFSVFGFMVIKCTLPEVLMFWLPMYISSNIALKMLSRNIRTTKWSNVYETILFPFMLFPIISESLGFSLKKFKVTKKGSTAEKKEKVNLYLIPFAFLSLLTVIGIVNCVLMMFESGNLSPIIVLFWLCVNLFNLAMSMFFVMGRRFFRFSERVATEAACKLLLENNKEICCYSKDISETGVSILLDEPMDINEDEAVACTLTTDRYEARLKLKSVNVSALGEKWKYSFRIVDTCGTYNDYLQILYDRVNTLPTKLEKSINSFDDLQINYKKRREAALLQNRRYPRVDIWRQVPVKGGGSVHIVNFNYKFVLLQGETIPERLSLLLDEDLILECSDSNRSAKTKKLYAVNNYDELHYDPQKYERLRLWLMESMKRNKNIGAEKKAKLDDLAVDMLGEAWRSDYANI